MEEANKKPSFAEQDHPLLAVVIAFGAAALVAGGLTYGSRLVAKDKAAALKEEPKIEAQDPCRSPPPILPTMMMPIINPSR